MSVILVEGGRKLSGAVTVQGAKNSVLPMLAATVLCPGVCCLRGCPTLSDVDTAVQIIRHLGGIVHREGPDLVVDTRQITGCEIPEELMGRMRSSVMFLGAILGRCGEAVCSQPGGCDLGPRPIDLHLYALRAMGAEIEEKSGRLRCRGAALHGAEIFLRTPSVGATENAILAACAASGTTVISNAAREPEIMELQDFLRAMGACVQGAGSATVVVEGRKKLHGCTHRVRPDRIVAATYLCAAAGAGGCVYLHRADYRHLAAVLCILQKSGCEICSDGGGICLKSGGRLLGVPPVRTSPYPGFPTDDQALLMAALTRSRGSRYLWRTCLPTDSAMCRSLLKWVRRFALRAKRPSLPGCSGCRAPLCRPQTCGAARPWWWRGCRHRASPGWSRSITSSGATPI